jgi:hypothetical protein
MLNFPAFFLDLGSQFLTVENGLDIASIISVYNSVLFAYTPQDSIPAEYIALLCQALEPDVGEWPDVTFQDCHSAICVPDQLILNLLRYSRTIVVEYLPELFA